MEELSCRVDLRQIDRSLINKVLSLATQFDCLLMDRQGRLFEHIITALGDTIQLSNAKRFVTKPKKTRPEIGCLRNSHFMDIKDKVIHNSVTCCAPSY